MEGRAGRALAASGRTRMRKRTRGRTDVRRGGRCRSSPAKPAAPGEPSAVAGTRGNAAWHHGTMARWTGGNDVRRGGSRHAGWWSNLPGRPVRTNWPATVRTEAVPPPSPSEHYKAESASIGERSWMTGYNLPTSRDAAYLRLSTQTTKCGLEPRSEEPFDLDLFLAGAMGFIPMQFSHAYRTKQLKRHPLS